MNQNYCIFCKYIQTTGFNNKKGIFEHYCPKKKKSVKTITLSCENFKQKEKANNTDVIEITVNI